MLHPLGYTGCSNRRQRRGSICIGQPGHQFQNIRKIVSIQRLGWYPVKISALQKRLDQCLVHIAIRG